MSNIAGKAYAMNVLTPMRPSRTWVNRLIHFARWVIIKRNQWPSPNDPEDEQALENDYMLFCSNFNGTWDQYIDAFSDGIPDGLDLFWYSSTKYPNSIPITPFKNYITHNQVDTDYYYNATPGSAQRDVKGVLKVYDALILLAEQHKSAKSPEQFATAYTEALGKVQSCLGDPGYGPVASLDTEHADERRKEFVKAIWA